MRGALDGACEEMDRAKAALLQAERALTVLPIAAESRRPEIHRDPPQRARRSGRRGDSGAEAPGVNGGGRVGPVPAYPPPPVLSEAGKLPPLGDHGR